MTDPAPNIHFPTHDEYWMRDLLGRARLTWCGLLPLIGRIQTAIRKYVGTEDAMDALFRLDARCRSIEGMLDSVVADLQAIRKDLDADQQSYATEHGEDLQRLSTLEGNLQTASSAINGVTLLALAWREIPILKAAEAKAQKQREKNKADRLHRVATTAKNGAHPPIVVEPEPQRPEGD